MTWDLAAFKTQQRTRIAAGMCPQCGEPPIPGQRLCATHRDKARERNRRYEQRKRDRGDVTPARVMRTIEAERRHRDECALVAFAAREGRVPTLPECARIIANTAPRSTYVQQRRRAAFLLRPIKSGRTVIPFPVPHALRVSHPSTDAGRASAS